MKQAVLISILIISLFIANAGANEPDSPIIHPYSMDSIYRQEAKQYVEYVETNWKLYNIGAQSLTQMEQMVKAEYQSRKMNCSVGLKLDHFKPSLTTKIQFFNKPIYFVFSVTD